MNLKYPLIIAFLFLVPVMADATSTEDDNHAKKSAGSVSHINKNLASVHGGYGVNFAIFLPTPFIEPRKISWARIYSARY